MVFLVEKDVRVERRLIGPLIGRRQTDIIERLRLTDQQLAREAAGEIERLCAHAVKMRALCQDLAEHFHADNPTSTGGEDAEMA